MSERWVARYHGSVDGSSDAAVAMALDNAGNVYVTGRSQGAGTGIDYATVAYDPKGNQLWAARYNGPENGDDLVNGIAVDSKAGHVYVTGQSTGTGTGSDSATVAYDFQGNQLWVARYNGPLADSSYGAVAIALDRSTGNVYVTGDTVPVLHGGTRTTTVAYDSTGNQLWVAIDNTNSSKFDYELPNSIVADSTSGNFYVTGVFYPAGGDPHNRTVAWDRSGNQLWAADPGTNVVGGPVSYGVAVALGDTGNIYVAGQGSFGDGNLYTTLAYDPAGNLLWSQWYTGGQPNPILATARGIRAIGTDSNTGNVYVTGYSGTVAYDSQGNQLWVANYSAGLDANAMAVDGSTGNVYVTGTSPRNPFRVNDYVTVAYDSSGNQLWAARYATGSSGFLPVAATIGVDSNTGNVYVAGQTQGSVNGTDFTTIAYSRPDTTPPVTTAIASPGANSNGWNNSNVTVTLNSTDSENGGTGVKQIQYALSGAQSLDTQTLPGSVGSVTISAEGMTTLTYFGTDNAGNAEQSKALTVQIDKTPPVVSGMPSGCALWPPNNKMVQVATITAADALSGLAPGSFQVTGSSNEPSDPNNPDVVITPNGSGGYSVQLRAARLGSGTGRTYTLQATATDLAGNTATATATCSVPHNR
ncbi:MAG TPA: hypothetical protein VJO16_19210 [Candidatus Acidoferrum sp.]|nr:hypothetical protein [Candidatus Acidoferrum sp.]